MSLPSAARSIAPAESAAPFLALVTYPSRRSWQFGVIASLIAALVFARVTTLDFVSWDDNIHIYQNPYLLPVTPAHLARFWVTSYHGLYIPLSYALFALLASLARLAAPNPVLTETGTLLNPYVFHAASLVFHAVNVLLVFLLIRRCVRRDIPAAAGALLFALHPMQVESVAWASELRGLASAFLCLSSLLLALPRAADDRPASWRQIGAVTLGAMALLCKPSAVVLPVALLVLDRWFFGRSWKSSIVVTAPLLALGAAFVLITQHVQSVPAEFLTPVWTRPFLAGDALSFYVGKLVLPIRLGIDYGRTPHWVMAQPGAYMAWLVPAAVAALAVLVSRRGVAWLGSGLLLSVVFLAPVLGLTPFAFQEYSTVADRYVYLALLGPALILAFALRATEQDPNRQRLVTALATLALCVLGASSFKQIGVWRNTGTLMVNAMQVNDRSDLAFFDYGDWLDRHGRIQNAVIAYRAAIQANPDSYPAHLNLSQDDLTLGRLSESLMEAEQAERLDPAAFTPHFLLGNVYTQMGRNDDAVAEYKAALLLKPGVAGIHMNLGIVLQRQGKTAGAITEFQQAIQDGVMPVAVHADLGTLLMQAHRSAEALTEFRAALALAPQSADLHALIGNALAALGNAQGAGVEYQQALSLDPSCTLALSGLKQLGYALPVP